MTVLITTEDIIRIIKNTPLSPEKFLTLYIATEKNTEFFPKIIINSEDVVIGLRQREDGSCIFYLNEIGMCGIHLYKPMVCNTYPFTLNADDEIVRLENICPAEWLPKDIDDIKHTVHAAWEEMDKNKEKITKWNEKNSKNDFHSFIEFIQK